ncbi:MAG: hypothetical protein V9G29_11555 [Burkholderiaceae bacterium]
MASLITSAKGRGAPGAGALAGAEPAAGIRAPGAGSLATTPACEVPGIEAAAATAGAATAAVAAAGADSGGVIDAQPAISSTHAGARNFGTTGRRRAGEIAPDDEACARKDGLGAGE